MRKFLYIICISVFLAGCSSPIYDIDAQVRRAERYASQGREYTHRAINLYKELISKQRSGALKEDLKVKLGDLYLSEGQYREAIDCFRGSNSDLAKKRLAISYVKNAQEGDALAIFERMGKVKDDEYLYYYGQALEKKNLYDKALDIYALVSENSKFYNQAKSRIEAINLSAKGLGEQDIASIIKNAPKKEDYPEAGAAILLSDEMFEVFNNNTSESDTHLMVKIFNDRGKESYSEIHIEYDSTFEDVKLEYARTIKPDGTVVYVGDKNIRDVSIYLNYPLYSNARAKIISMPEVEEGSIIEYRAKVTTNQLVNKKDFILNYAAQDVDPILNTKLVVKIPKDRSFNYKIINAQYNTFLAKLDPQVSETIDSKIFSWHLKDIPEVLPEPSMPPAARINPIVEMSSFSKWEDIYKWWYELYKDKISINQGIQNKIDDLVKDKQAQEDKIRAIYNFCAQDIRYVAVEYGQAGYEPHKAVDIFQNKYGDCKDKAILLIAMLRAIGINAYPVLIGTSDVLDLNTDFPSLTFNHCIAVVNLNDRWLFMDPTGQTVSFGDLPSMDQDRQVFLVLDDGYKIESTPLFASDKNYSHIKMDVKINTDETIYVKRDVDTRGVFQQAQRYWLKFTKPKLIEDTLQATANNFAPGAKLTNYNVKNADSLDENVILDYEFNAPEFLTKAGKSRLIPQLGGIDISSVSKEKRVYPIESEVLVENITDAEMEIPKSLIVKYMPENIKVDSDWFDFENSYTKKSNKILFSQKYKTKKKIILQDEYSKYKKLVEDIARRINQNIILEEK